MDLTPRNGAPPRVIFKGCHKLESIDVDFDGNGDPYLAQWWRCGSANPNRKKGRFPINYVVVQPPRDKVGASAVTLTNSGSSDEYFIEHPQKITIESGARQVLLVSGHYYDPGEDKASCLLGLVGDRFDCWPQRETQKILEASSAKHDKGLFRKLDEFFSGQNLPY